MPRVGVSQRDAVLAGLSVPFSVPIAVWAYLGSFSRYMADDFCYSVEALTRGWLGAQVHWFSGWSGRYAYTLAVTSAALLGPWTAPVLPGLTLIAWLLALTACAGQGLQATRTQRPWPAGLVVALVVLFATVAAAPNIAQSLYWRNGLLTYALPLVLLTGYAAWLLYRMRQAVTGGAGWAWLAASAGLSFIVGGFSEVASVLQFGLLGLALVGVLVLAPQPFKRRAAPLLLAGLLGAGLALLAVAASPGTQNRQGDFGPPPALEPLLRNARQYALWFLRDVWAGHALTWLTALILPALVMVAAGARTGQPALRWRGLLGTLLLAPPLTFAVLWACYVPAFYVLRYLPPDRVVIIQTFVLMTASAVWGCALGVAAHRLLAERLPQPAAHLAGTAALVVAALLAVVVPLRAAQTHLAERAALQAFAATADSYDQKLRAAQAAGAVDATLTILPYPGRIDRLSEDNRFWANRCMGNYYGLWITALPAPTAATPAELGQRTPVEARIGQVADVMGYTLAPARPRAGETLSVTIFWQPRAHTTQPYTAFVHLIDPATGSLAQVDRYPGAGRYPTDRWLLDLPFADTFVLEIPAEAAASNATLVLGLYDLATLQRLPVTGANAGPNGEGWVQLGSVEVTR